MTTARRNAVRLALYCAHPACSEEVSASALRDDERFTVRLPRGWARVHEERADPNAPHSMPALCPAHRPDPRVFIARSMGEIAQRIAAIPRGKASRDVRVRLARYARIVEGWKNVEPSEEQLAAMADLVARVRDELGLPPGLVSGFVSRKQG